MRRILLFEQFTSQTDATYVNPVKFYSYSVKPGQEVIIRNDTQGREDLKVPLAPMRDLLESMGGPDSIKTDFKVHGSVEPFAIDFAMSACLFEPDGSNTGLFRFYKKGITPKNMQTNGNFGMHLDENSGERNGVFYGEKDKWSIVGTSEFTDTLSPFAIQNGPILVYDGEINSAFKKESKNVTHRAGIGVDKDGKPHFAISLNSDCNFYNLADHFLNTLKCPNAIYADGTVVQAYSREGGKYMGGNGNIAPLILVTSKTN